RRRAAVVLQRTKPRFKRRRDGAQIVRAGRVRQASAAVRLADQSVGTIKISVDVRGGSAGIVRHNGVVENRGCAGAGHTAAKERAAEGDRITCDCAVVQKSLESVCRAAEDAAAAGHKPAGRPVAGDGGIPNGRVAARENSTTTAAGSAAGAV